MQARRTQQCHTHNTDKCCMPTCDRRLRTQLDGRPPGAQETHLHTNRQHIPLDKTAACTNHVSIHGTNQRYQGLQSPSASLTMQSVNRHACDCGVHSAALNPRKRIGLIPVLPAKKDQQRQLLCRCAHAQALTAARPSTVVRWLLLMLLPQPLETPETT